MPSTSLQIKEKVYEIMNEYKIHDIEEIKQKCLKDGIINDERCGFDLYRFF